MSLATLPARPTTPVRRHSGFRRSPRWRSGPNLAARAVSVAVALAVVGAIVFSGANRRPVDATLPIEIRGEATRPSDHRLRIGTFNIHGGRGADGGVNLQATARVMDDQAFDLVGLYEVRGGYTTDQAATLGELVNMASVFAGTERRWWREHFGNGLLIGSPARSVVCITLPGTQGKRYRNALLTTIEVAGTPVHVISAHIDTRVDRDRQLTVVTELFRSLKSPAVLMGDLNCTVDHPALARLIADEGVIDTMAAVPWPLPDDEERIDHILTRGLVLIDSGIEETTASDHPYLWAELAIPEESDETATHR